MTHKIESSRQKLKNWWAGYHDQELSDNKLKQRAEKSNVPVKKFLTELLQEESGPILDIGSSIFSHTYHPDNIDSVAINWISEGLPNKGSRVQAEAERLPFPNKTFPIVISKQVYGYCFEPEILVSEMTRVLDKGGFFALIDFEGKMAEDDFEGEPPRIWDFQPDILEKQLSNMGIEVNDIARLRYLPDFEISSEIRSNIFITAVVGRKI